MELQYKGLRILSRYCSCQDSEFRSAMETSSVDIDKLLSKNFFLSLIDKHFPKDKKLSKIFNRNTIKVSYSCLPNVKQTISNNNHRLLQLHRMKESTQDSKLCNCRQKSSCPLDGKLLRRECNLLTAVKGFKVDLEASRT